jgi:hypothetical protein
LFRVPEQSASVVLAQRDHMACDIQRSGAFECSDGNRVTWCVTARCPLELPDVQPVRPPADLREGVLRWQTGNPSPRSDSRQVRQRSANQLSLCCPDGRRTSAGLPRKGREGLPAARGDALLLLPDVERKKEGRVIRRWIAKLVGRWCIRHERGYSSDFCPECMRYRVARSEASDTRPEWTKAEGSWPINREGGDAA